MEQSDQHILTITFTEEQVRRLMSALGIAADGLSIEKSSGKAMLVNPRKVESFKIDDSQRSSVKNALGKEYVGLLIEPHSYGVDLVQADDVRIQMWGEYRD
jgi:hypothetical protein